MDTTYWGRNYGLMVIKDALRNKILWHKYVKHETIADYMEDVEWLEKNGFTIYGVVCDACAQPSSMPVVLLPLCKGTQIMRDYKTFEGFSAYCSFVS